MNRVDEINTQIAKLEAERASAMLAERANVLAKMKADIKLYGFKTTTYSASTRKRTAIDRYSAGIKSVLDLSISWVSNPNPSLNGNYRVPFNSRILFFCAPEMMTFNYSNELGKAMQIQTRPQAA